LFLIIKSNRDLIKSLSYTRKKEELEKILSSKNSCKGLKLLKELHLLDTLEINYDKIVYVPDIIGNVVANYF
jgi:tRNA nucleotidyltransferase/poly(A) polymerase